MKLQPRDYQSEAKNKAIAFMRATSEPGILELSTAAGKSVIVALIAHVVNASGKRVLCLQPNGDLAAQNAEKYRATGELCSLFSASLGQKKTSNPVVFATPITVANSLDRFNDQYALVVVDECDGVSEDEATTYQKIFAHLRFNNPKLRILGLTATPMRGKNKLVDKGNTFKHTIYSMPHHALSKLGWVVPYRLGVTHEHYEMASIKVQSNGRFKQSDIDDATLNKERLTSQICADVVQIMDVQGRRCAMFFAASIKHAEEILSYLPAGKATIVTGKTEKALRKTIIETARDGRWPYLVTVNALSVGTDIPIVDTVVFLRASESVRLLLQMMGRGCRLYAPNWSLLPSLTNWMHPHYDGKEDCLILDYAENVERHGLEDDLSITGLVSQKDIQDEDGEYFPIACPECETENRHTAHRCVGIVDGKRCDYRFVFKECPACKTANSQSARHCRKCDHELIDPNDKLTRKAARAPGEPFYTRVQSMTLRPHFKNGERMLRVDYDCEDLSVSEYLKSEHENPYHRRRYHAWAQLVGAQGRLVDEVISQAESLKMPEQLLVKKEKGSKYYSVESRK